jgi:hypothetical protein
MYYTFKDLIIAWFIGMVSGVAAMGVTVILHFYV